MNSNYKISISSLKKLSFFSIVGFAYFILFYKDAIVCPQNGASALANMYQHIELARSWLNGAFLPEPGWHILTIITAKILGISLLNAALIIQTLFTVLTAFLIFYILSSYLRETYSENFLLLFSAALMLVVAIYLPGFSWNMYLGQGNPNMVNSVTLTMVKPFMLVCIIFFLNLLKPDNLNDIYIWYGLLSISLFISVFIKPFFALVFLPALAAYLVLTGIKSKKQNFYLFFVILPAIVGLAWQAYNTLIAQGTGYRSGVIINPFYVWQTVSPSIPVSIVLATAFPLAVVFLDPKKAWENKGLVFSWLMVIVGILEFSLLMETVNTFAFNWLWGYNLALLLLFIFSSIEFLKSLKDKQPRSFLLKTGIFFCAMLFLLHLISGIVYFKTLLDCGSFL
jgi:hypothetical protein